jgi:hypothetical protein
MLKNITLRVDEKLIRKAREKAQREHTTLNENFRIWLRRYLSSDTNLLNYDNLMKELSYSQPGKTFTRTELNERLSF